MKCFLLLAALSVRLARASTLLFGPPCLNRIACDTNVYGFSDPPTVPQSMMEKVKDIKQNKVFPIIESSFYTGFSNQIATCVLRLRTEFTKLEEDLAYPRVLHWLRLAVTKDYVRANATMADLNNLRMLHYVQRAMLGFANSGFNEKAHVDKNTRRQKYCSAMVYIDIAEKLGRYRKKQIHIIEAEVKRLVSNLNNIPAVKSTGNIYLMVDHFHSGAALLATVVPLVVFGLYSLV